MALNEHFAISAGSIIGREHVRLHRNDQDAFAVAVRPERIAAVVADGCGEGRFSEVGARLGARFIARWLVELDPVQSEAGWSSALPVQPERSAQRGVEGSGDPCARDQLRDSALHGSTDPLTLRLRPYGATLRVNGGAPLGATLRVNGGALVEALLDYLRPLVPSDSPSEAAAFVRDHLLFTFLAILMDEARTTVFGVGDGVFCLNGRAVVIPSGEDNAPPYVGYGLVPSSALERPPRSLRPVVHVSLPTAEIRSLLIGTDGLAALEPTTSLPLADGAPQEDLGALARDLRYAKNPTLLQRRLVVLGERNRRFHDDATAVLVQRREV